MTDIERLTELVIKFRDERDWNGPHFERAVVRDIGRFAQDQGATTRQYHTVR